MDDMSVCTAIANSMHTTPHTETQSPRCVGTWTHVRPEAQCRARLASVIVQHEGLNPVLLAIPGESSSGGWRNYFPNKKHNAYQNNKHDFNKKYE